jgi:hypothetical protein
MKFSYRVWTQNFNARCTHYVTVMCAGFVRRASGRSGQDKSDMIGIGAEIL